MTKFDLETLRPLCKSIFDHWRKAGKTDTNIGSNGDGSSLEVPRTLDLWESRPMLYLHWAMESLFDKQYKTLTHLLNDNLTEN